MSVIKIVLPFDRDEHQGGVDAVLLKTVWVFSSTERTIKKQYEPLAMGWPEA